MGPPPPTTVPTTHSTTSPPPPTTTLPPPPPTMPTVEENSEESTKLAFAMTLLRTKLLSQPPPPPPSSALRWKKKAKDRKQEVLRLTDELKHLEEDLRGDLYPQSAACKCYFFKDLQNLSPNEIKHCSDHRLNDVLRRRFLRQVRLQKRIKGSASGSTDRRGFSELYKEEEMEQLKISAEFLVDLCDTPNPVKTPQFANLAHQAVDLILGSLKYILSTGQEAAAIEGIISSLIVRLVKRMCTPMEDELYCDPETDAQIHIQHVIRKLGNVSYIGQRVLLSVCHCLSEQAEVLLSLDPFNESFSLIHDSMFAMIQLIEFLVSDYIVTWSKEEGFDIRLFEDWLTSFFHARKALQSMEKRSGLYALYVDRVTGELARQVGQFSFLPNLNQDILDNLLS